MACDGDCAACGAVWTKQVCCRWGENSDGKIPPIRCSVADCEWHKAYETLMLIVKYCWHGPFEPGGTQEAAHWISKMAKSCVLVEYTNCPMGFGFVKAIQPVKGEGLEWKN